MCHSVIFSVPSVGLDGLCWHNFDNNSHLKELGIVLEKQVRNLGKKRTIGTVSQSTSPKVKQSVNFAYKWARERGGARVFCMGFGN